jgi:predicted restriction endonuclease
MARRVYRNSGRPFACVLCEYATHVDICHVKDIRSYAHGTPYSVINDQANLIALCRNHHWEFDHDLLLGGTPESP